MTMEEKRQCECKTQGGGYSYESQCTRSATLQREEQRIDPDLGVTVTLCRWICTQHNKDERPRFIEPVRFKAGHAAIRAYERHQERLARMERELAEERASNPPRIRCEETVTHRRMWMGEEQTEQRPCGWLVKADLIDEHRRLAHI